jgi:hypothetical protein
MAEEIVSLAVIEALPDMRDELLKTLRELSTLMQAKAIPGTHFFAMLLPPSVSCFCGTGALRKCAPRPNPIPRYIAIG